VAKGQLRSFEKAERRATNSDIDNMISRQQELRAYVYIEGISIANVATPIKPDKGDLPPRGDGGYLGEIIHPHQGPHARYVIENYGKTPASKVFHWADIDVREFPLQSDLAIGDLDEAITIPIPPNGKATKTVKYPNPLTEKQLKGLRDNMMAIYIWGRISYLDAYNVRQTTDYCVFQNDSVGYIGISDAMRAYPGKNHAT
jgi:hypothetical protein